MRSPTTEQPLDPKYQRGKPYSVYSSPCPTCGVSAWEWCRSKSHDTEVATTVPHQARYRA